MVSFCQLCGKKAMMSGKMSRTPTYVLMDAKLCRINKPRAKLNAAKSVR